MLKLFIGKQEVEVKIFKFPAGESGVSFDVTLMQYSRTTEKIPVMITLIWQSNDDIINMALLVDALRRTGYPLDLSLDIKYFPYARQDRVCNAGESLSVKVIADIINSMNFSRVYVLDPHSDVLGAVLNNMIVYDSNFHIRSVLRGISCKHIVSPDAGALKKSYKIAQACSEWRYDIDVVRADKTRDTKTGVITGTVVYSEHLGDANLLVVDDICDGGGTFIPLAQELRKITDGTISLYVSHGLFTKGVDILAEHYDNIFVTNNLNNHKHHKLIEA